MNNAVLNFQESTQNSSRPLQQEEQTILALKELFSLNNLSMNFLKKIDLT
jgi:hypothetical protein